MPRTLELRERLASGADLELRVGIGTPDGGISRTKFPTAQLTAEDRLEQAE